MKRRCFGRGTAFVHDRWRRAVAFGYLRSNLVETLHRLSADEARASIASGRHDPATFRAALVAVPAPERDSWLDLVLGLDGFYDDGPELPAGCVPYLPCPVDVLLRMVDQAAVRPDDVFVDIGSGPGRAALAVHLLTGAAAIGLEVQPALVCTARGVASRLGLSRVPSVEGDAATHAAFMTIATVFFLYCPFSGPRLERVLDDLEAIARTRALRICCVNLPPRRWLARDPGGTDDLVVYRSTSG